MKKLALTLLFLGATYSATRLVPGDYPSIQAAIDASVDYDTIQVDAGTYNENINFTGKNITVVGENQETTIIDGGANGSVVKFNSQEGEAAALTGFTITNGEAVEGGGIYISEESNPTLTSLTISGNTANYFGGGIYIRESSPILTNQTISGNAAEDGGGGVYTRDSNPTFISSIIWGNLADSGNSFYSDSEDSAPTILFSNGVRATSLKNVDPWSPIKILSAAVAPRL